MQKYINKLFNEKEESLLKSLIGQKLIKLRHDAYINSNVSFRKVSFFFKDKIYILSNLLEFMDFMWDNEDGYGDEDVAVFSFSECNEEATNEKYGFDDNLKIIDVPINEIIKDIIVIEDDVKAYDSKTKEFVSEYEYVKGVIFVFEGFKYCFSRGDWFIEHIDINKGVDPESKLGDINEDWDWAEDRYSINTRKFRSLNSN